MEQLTVRGFEPQLAHILQSMAQAEHISLSQAALKLMRKGAGLTDTKQKPCIGNSLDHFIGAMSAQEVSEFEDLTANTRQIDQELWQ